MKRSFVHLLDRPGLRNALARLGTLYARRFSPDAEIMHNGELWLHKSNGYWLPDGTRFEYTKDTLADDVSGRSFRDVADIWFFAYEPKAGDTIIDVGAGQGEDLLPMAKAVGLTGRVVAIEAHPNSFKWLAAMVKHNHLAQVQTINAAVMDVACEVKIEDTDTWVGNRISEDGAFSVRGVTLDDLCADFPRIDFLKMNIEGAERLAIRGARETMRRVVNVCIACHDFRSRRGDVGDFETREEVIDFLHANGFSTRTRADDPRDYVRDYVYGYKEELH